MGNSIGKKVGEEITLHLNVTSFRFGLLTQPAGYPKARIIHIDGSDNEIIDMAETIMDPVPGRVGEFFVKYTIATDLGGLQLKAFYTAEIDEVEEYDFDIINVETIGASAPPHVDFN